MPTEEQHVALPQLYGAPAYARPVAPVPTAPRPLDPDDLPIEAAMSEEERAYAASLPARAWASSGGIAPAPDGKNYGQHGQNGHGDPNLRPRQLSLRSIAGKLLGGN
ncbi:MAG: hypothetical protein ABIP77_00370 [Candidatus Limnocylindrales bacterium]